MNDNIKTIDFLNIFTFKELSLMKSIKLTSICENKKDDNLELKQFTWIGIKIEGIISDKFKEFEKFKDKLEFIEEICIYESCIVCLSDFETKRLKNMFKLATNISEYIKNDLEIQKEKGYILKDCIIEEKVLDTTGWLTNCNLTM
ncbi:hypothetical protein [Clostridium tetani]|nr:hypothetical protein [Clostridium tetani]WFN63299.1 hypothetical protein PAA20_13715 [Clostridium tetani]